MPSGFKYLDHVTDAYVEAFGSSIEEAFNQSARGLINIMFDLNTVKGCKPRTLCANGNDTIQLLYDWLEKILWIIYTDSEIMSRFDVTISKSDSSILLEAKTLTESLDLEKHNYKTEVKGITFHQMQVLEKKNKCTCKYIADL
jgi:SHS2 domain-containing protein